MHSLTLQQQLLLYQTSPYPMGTMTVDQLLDNYNYNYSYSTTMLLLDRIEHDNYLDPRLSEQLGMHIMSALKSMNVNEKNTTHNKITDLMYKSIDFHPHFIIRYLREYESMIPEVMICYDHKLNYNFIHSISSYLRNCSHYCALLKKIFYHHGVTINFTANEVDQYMKFDSPNKYVVEKIIIDGCIQVNRDFINNIILLHSYDLLIQLAPLFNGLFTQESLENACKSLLDRYNKIEFMLDNKVTISKIAFDAVINQVPNNLIKINMNNTMQTIFFSNQNPSTGWIRIKDQFDKNHYINPRIYQTNPSFALHLLLEHGYPITKDDVYNALSRGVMIPNMNEYNVKLDVKYLQICAQLNIDPPCIVSYLVPDEICLNHAVYNVNFNSIKNIIKKNEIKPTTRTLYKLCEHPKQTKILEFLISHGAVVDFQCIKLFLNSIVKYKKEKDRINQTIKILESIYSKDKFFDFDLLYRLSYFYNVRFGSILFRELKNNFSDKLMNDYHDTNTETGTKTNTETNTETNTSQTHVINNENDSLCPCGYNESDCVCENYELSLELEPRLEPEIKSNEPVFNLIPKQIKQILKITKTDQDINYIEFRRKVIEYHVSMNCIDQSVHGIIPQKYFNFNYQHVNFSDINDWIIGLLAQI